MNKGVFKKFYDTALSMDSKLSIVALLVKSGGGIWGLMQAKNHADLYFRKSFKDFYENIPMNVLKKIQKFVPTVKDEITRNLNEEYFKENNKYIIPVPGSLLCQDN